MTPLRHHARALVAATLVGGAVTTACTLSPLGTADVQCGTTTTACGGACVDLKSDAAHCGACGNACDEGLVCSGGACASGCTFGLTKCGGTCVDTESNAAHCGACDRACDAGITCGGGECQLEPCMPGSTDPCYTGPFGTSGVGVCKAGTRTCNAQGTGYGPCEGEVHPQPEICANGIDEDCNTVDKETGCFADRGLVARYFIDEAAGGQNPPVLVDAAPDPLPLLLTYTPELTFIDDTLNRALVWSASGIDARASVAVDGTKFDSMLQGSTTGTLEVVFDITAVTDQRSRIIHFGLDQESGRFTLFSTDVGSIEAVWNGASTSLGRWAVQLAGRKVVHLVLNTNAPTPPERVQLYVNGVPTAPTASTLPTAGSTLDLGINRHFVLGNREAGDRSFTGRLYYAAVYNVAFTPVEVAQNLQVLIVDDDTPLP
jgi:hypothetical protein